jgi:hypothetical protein
MCTVIYLVFRYNVYHRAFTTYEKAQEYIQNQLNTEPFEIISEETNLN